MMQVNRRVDYAMRSMAYMAAQPRDRVVLIDDIADHMSVPRAFLSKIMKQLVTGDLVRSFMGPGGGYALARDPGEITFRHIIEAVDGQPMRVIACTSDDGATVCALHEACTQAPVWEEIERRMLDVFDEFTLEQVKARPGPGGALTLTTTRGFGPGPEHPNGAGPSLPVLPSPTR